MPEMNGQEFMRHVRGDLLAANLPIILFSGMIDMSEKIAGFEAGVDDYMVKSVDPTEPQPFIMNMFKL